MTHYQLIVYEPELSVEGAGPPQSASKAGGDLPPADSIHVGSVGLRCSEGAGTKLQRVTAQWPDHPINDSLLLPHENKISALIAGLTNFAVLRHLPVRTVVDDRLTEACEQRLGRKELFLIVLEPFDEVLDKHALVRDLFHRAAC